MKTNNLSNANLNENQDVHEDDRNIPYNYSRMFQELVEFINNTEVDHRLLPHHSTFFTTKTYRFNFGRYGKDGFINSVYVKGEYGSIIEFIENGENGIEIINIQYSNILSQFNDFESLYLDFIALVNKVYDASVRIHIFLTDDFLILTRRGTSYENMLEVLKKVGFRASYVDYENEMATLYYKQFNEYEVTDFADDNYEIEFHRSLPRHESEDDDCLPF